VLATAICMWLTILDPNGTSGVRVAIVMVNSFGEYCVMVAVSCAMLGLRIAVCGIRKEVFLVVLRKSDAGNVLVCGGGVGSPMY